jgi:hypothetical protein
MTEGTIMLSQQAANPRPGLRRGLSVLRKSTSRHSVKTNYQEVFLMMKRIFASAMVLLMCVGMALTGCESVNGPNSATNVSQSLTGSLDVTSLEGQTSLLKSAGVNTDSANAFFVLRWSKGLEHFQSSDTVLGHASAVAYEQPATLRDRNAIGLDMGTVSVVIDHDTYELPKLETLLGVRYGGPEGCQREIRGEMGGPHGGRGGHGRPPIGDHIAVVNVPFVSGGNYQFKVTGAGTIAAMTLDIQAPSQVVQFSGVADKDTIDATQDLTIAWKGDATANNMVLVLGPAFKRGRFGEPGQPVAPVFQAVDAAAGSYTIPAQTLQNLLSASNAKALDVHVSQGKVNESTDAQLGKILVSASTDDHIILIVK